MWQQWTNVVLGFVVVIVPFLDLTAATTTWTLIIAGAAIAAMGLWGARETSIERDRRHMIERRVERRHT